MVREALILFILTAALSPSDAEAHVEVLSTRPSCQAVLREKSIQGIVRSLDNDPTLTPVQPLSPDAYAKEARIGIERVREVYREIMRSRGMPEPEIEKLLKEFEADDEAHLNSMAGLGKADFGLENTAFFVFKSSKGVPMGVIRATYVRKGEKRKLPLERKITVPDENRVEFERAFNQPGQWSEIISREVLMVAAQNFKERFGSNDYVIYNLTDAPRARLYRSRYDFDLERRSELPKMYEYLGKQRGDKFYDRYIGHEERAYALAYRAPYSKASALAVLDEMARAPGMKDYIPTLRARSSILASQQKYAEALAVSDRLNEIGSAQVNDDYNVLWRARVAYDPILLKGDPARALEIVREHLAIEGKGIDPKTFAIRSLLYTIFELKILLGAQRFDEAEALVKKMKIVLKEGRELQRPIYQAQMAQLAKYMRIDRPSWATARFIQMQYIWDLSTHADFYSTSVLYPETYAQAAADTKAIEMKELSDHYRLVSRWVERVLVPALR